MHAPGAAADDSDTSSEADNVLFVRRLLNLQAGFKRDQASSASWRMNTSGVEHARLVAYTHKLERAWRITDLKAHLLPIVPCPALRLAGKACHSQEGP